MSRNSVVFAFWIGVGVAAYCLGGATALGVAAIAFCVIQILP